MGRVTVGGTLRDSTGVHASPMRVLGSYAWVYLTSGSGWFQEAGRPRRRVRAGDLLLLFPEIPHAYGPDAGGRWDEIHAVFDGPVFDLWRARGLLVPEQPVRSLRPIRRWFLRFASVLAPALSPLERVVRLQEVLAQALASADRSRGPSRDTAWAARARALLEENPGSELYLSEVARALGMSEETFRKRFVRATGVSPWRYRLTRRTEIACRWLHEGGLSNKEIAARLGFSDEFHFSRCFKRITGRSPTQFRALVDRG